MAGRYRAPRTWIAIFGVSECMLQTQCVWNNQHCWAVLIRSDDNNQTVWKHISPNSRTLQTQLASSHRPCKGTHLMCSVSVSTFEQAQQTFSSPSPIILLRDEPENVKCGLFSNEQPNFSASKRSYAWRSLVCHAQHYYSGTELCITVAAPCFSSWKFSIKNSSPQHISYVYPGCPKWPSPQ